MEAKESNDQPEVTTDEPGETEVEAPPVKKKRKGTVLSFHVL